MGNSQSGPSGVDRPIQAKRTCYYEILGVERQAPDEEIRRAYKRKALELHPDRNLDDTENATRKFAEVQSAYEILSDPQERAWYDSHREAILRGDDDKDLQQDTPEQYNIRLTTADDLYVLIGRFNSTVPMTDDATGFYGILNQTFNHLADEEAAVCSWEGLDQVDYPAFGASSADYNSVAKPFYHSWSAFATRKSFSWRDKYRLSDAPDRRVRRLMEKENKKLRDEAIREFNDAVRSLVAFVKKRDRRYIPSTMSEAERQQALRDASAAQAARSRAANQARMAESVVPDWVKASAEPATGHEGTISGSDDEEEIQVIECVVCDKEFKSEGQFEAHEKSKKHKTAVKQLQRQMQQENSQLSLKTTTNPDTESPLVQSPLSSTRDTADISGETNKGGLDRGDPISEAKPEASSTNGPSAENSHEPQAEEDESSVPVRSQEEVVELADRMESVSLDVQPTKKIGKAKAKREKKAARDAAAELRGQDTNHSCAVCKTSFQSRTKLFTHLREAGHAEPIPQNSKRGKKPKR